MLDDCNECHYNGADSEHEPKCEFGNSIDECDSYGGDCGDGEKCCVICYEPRV